MSNIIIIAVLVLVAILAIRGSRQHFKGEGSCCGGGGGTIEDHKALEGTKKGTKLVRIEGMHCENCQNRVQRSINRIDGAAAKVNLRRKEAVVDYDREIADGRIRQAVEDEGYQVVSIQDVPV